MFLHLKMNFENMKNRLNQDTRDTDLINIISNNVFDNAAVQTVKKQRWLEKSSKVFFESVANQSIFFQWFD